MTGTFSQEALDAVEAMFAETNPYEGQCGQKKLKEQNKTQRTPAQEQADQARSQALRGKDTMPSASRSAAAKKGAETRAKCKGGAKPPQTPG